MRELICITCPKGCYLKVDEENDYKVTGNGCPRGAIYGKKECTHPTRVVTSTVKIVGAEIERLSVKTNGDIPKEKIFDVMKELNHVEKSFGDLKVLKDISMSVEDGEIVSIIGPSGSGKSTLLRCATMLETMDRGEVVYLGKKAVWGNDSGSIQYASPAELKEIRSQYGLVFQNFNLFPHFSVMKNITDAPIHVQKRNKEEVYSEARELLKKMGLEDKEDAYPYQLSGGQCQRL